MTHFGPLGSLKILRHPPSVLVLLLGPHSQYFDTRIMLVTHISMLHSNIGVLLLETIPLNIALLIRIIFCPSICLSVWALHMNPDSQWWYPIEQLINCTVETHVDWWVSTDQLVNCCMRYHDGLSGLICRALSQPQTYKETFSFREVILHLEGNKYFVTRYPNLKFVWFEQIPSECI